MSTKINPFLEVKPMIYAYTTPGVTYNDGWTKIGYTEKQTVEDRIAQQVHTSGIRPQIEWADEAKYRDGSNEYFTDHHFHKYLTKFHNIKRKPGHEWFEITPSDAKQKFDDFANRNYDITQGAGDGEDYILRKEQQEAVQKTLQYAAENQLVPEFLWNAKPRFGKTLTTYDFVRQLKAKNVLIVTNRPAIANSWYEDFAKFISWQTGYIFVSETDALKDKPVLTRKQYVDKICKMSDEEADKAGCIAFESLQGLKGSVYFGGQYDKLKWIIDVDWDILVVDEAHEGVDTYKTDKAFDSIRRKFTLHLSGTPFKAIASGKFGAEQIYNWTFSDEQEAKESWTGEENNPYETMPRMNLFTYQLSKMGIDKANRGLEQEEDTIAFAFDLNELFKTENGVFVHKQDVRKFLDALTVEKRFPYSDEFRKEMRHTMWLLDRVDSCKALKKMLDNHPVFENYEIVLAAGNGTMGEDYEAEDQVANMNSYERVKKAIAEKDKTITLSVGQLTTGVTIPEWTGIFILSNMKSPAQYIQAAFRAQNPYKYKKGNKYYQKENAYVFDFSPERTLIVYDEFANSLYYDTAKGGGTKEQREENVKRLLNFFSVYAEDENGEMAPLDAGKVLTLPVSIKAEEVVNRGFMSNFLFNNLGNIFGAPQEVVDIISQLEPEDDPWVKRTTDLTLKEIEQVSTDGDGEVVVDQAIIVNSTEAIFGDKLYGAIDESDDLLKVFEAKQPLGERNPRPEEKVASHLADTIAEQLTKGIEEEAKEKYGLKDRESTRLAVAAKKKVAQELQRFAEDFTQQQRIAQIEHEKQIEQAETENEKEILKGNFAKEEATAQKEFVEKVKAKAQEVREKIAVDTVEMLEKRQEAAKAKDVTNDMRAHLRGFCRTIPSFIMAYGDDQLKLSNLEKYPPAEVFKEVTGITVKQFVFLRDGGDITNPQTGEVVHSDFRCFDEVVFDEAIQEFLRKKETLSDYFAEASLEDIFDYIPPQKTNQIFTPKKVVKLMVDELETENPGIFDQSDKTFLDLYMKSGLYIAEIVKRLFRSEKLKKEFPDDYDRLKHIMEKQVYGFAPTRIILAIATSYIFGFDTEHKISQENFKAIDATPYAKEGKLQELLDREFAK